MDILGLEETTAYWNGILDRYAECTTSKDDALNYRLDAEDVQGPDGPTSHLIDVENFTTDELEMERQRWFEMLSLSKQAVGALVSIQFTYIVVNRRVILFPLHFGFQP